MLTNRQEFLEVLQRYLEGSCSAGEKQIMDYWYGLLDQQQNPNPDPDEECQREDRLWAAIRQRTQTTPEPHPKNRIY
ncbi:hypothetical protein ACO2Q8_02840 [Larkinella sp. VNQ87]|uniref:hypothetical protein n=1 Tax=Larkinella sp. VNQ87 TaxID=3400921 RepID=UPI003C01582C